mgnify:CR=1 FL=1
MSVSQKTKEGIDTFLKLSDSYVVLPDEQAQYRLGGDPSRLSEQCDSDQACWSRALQRLGVDVLLRVEIIPTGDREEAMLHLYSSGDASKTGPHPLPRGGGAPLEALENLLLNPGTMEIALESGSTHLQINGQPRLLSPNPIVTASGLPPGNHKLIVEGLGLPQRVEVVRILPGQTVEIPLNSNPKLSNKKRHRWWGAWAGGALLIGGSIAIFSGSGRDGLGWR